MQLTQKKRQRTDLLTVAAVAALFVVMAALLYTGHLTRQVTNMLVPVAVYIVMAVSLNLVVGLLGELSLGHAGFMSVGLFSGCLVAIALHTTALPLGVRLPVSMLAGGLMAAVFGLLVGLPALRLRGVLPVCLFTGSDREVPDARRIYGQAMERLPAIGWLADAVTRLIRGQLRRG